MDKQGIAWILALSCASAALPAQTLLPNVDVRAPQWEARHGGYLVSGNFEVDPKMSAVVYPAEPFQKDDVLSVRLTQMHDDEYFILQECVSADCVQARIVRAWNAFGPLGTTTHHAEDRFFIPHEGKFFLWMQRISMSGSAGPFTGYEPFGPPLVFKPTGTSEQFHSADLDGAVGHGLVKVVSTAHEDATYIVRYEGGTSVLIQRMHAAE